MDRPNHSHCEFFTGTEVEKTPCHGQPTLFVVGLRTVEDIDRALIDANFTHAPKIIKHIFFGANDSYHPQNWENHQTWENVISTFLDRGFWCSLDIPFDQAAEFNESGLCERDRFIPIIKVPIPYIRLWNYNTCVKIDDRDFADTNPGVWVHQLHNLMAHDRFTDWSQYDKDHIV
jgi:hypothetical protein